MGGKTLMYGIYWERTNCLNTLSELQLLQQFQLDHWLFLNFGMVLETHMKFFGIEPLFENFSPKFGKMGEK